MNKESENKTNSKNRTMKIFIIGILAVLICAAISWGITTSLASSKTDQSTDINKINGSIGHLTDAATGLDNISGNLTAALADLRDANQTQFGQIDSKITTLTGNAQTDFDAAFQEIVDANTRIDDATQKIENVNTDLADLSKTLTSQITDANARIDDVSKTAGDTSDAVTALNDTVGTINAGLGTVTTNLTDLSGTVTTLSASVTADSNTVASLTFTIPSGAINAANGVDRYIWTSDGTYQITKIIFQQSAVESTGATTTLTIKKVPGGTAIGSGTDILASPVNLKTGLAANTPFTATLNSTAANVKLAAGDSLALDFTNTVTEYSGCVTITLKKI